jgi:hypothetical protein
LAGFKASFARAMRELRLDFRVSDLRRTAAVRFFGATDNLRATRQFLGHAAMDSSKWHRPIPLSEMVELQDQVQAKVRNERAKLE